MITYKGLPGPVIDDFLSREACKGHYAEGTAFHIGKIEMVANTGTYIDAPFHRFSHGRDISDMPLSQLADLPGQVVSPAPGKKVLGPEFFEGLELRGQAVLVRTGFDRFWGKDDYFRDSPFLTSDAASLLREAGAALVGIDAYNIDDVEDGCRPVHTLLLEAGIPIVEHLCGLESLPESGFRFFAVPVRVQGLGSFPVRAFALLN